MLLPPRERLVASFSEKGAPTSKKYVVEQGIVMLNWCKTFQTFSSHFSIFALEKQPKIPNFQSVFTSKRPFGGFFQWNAFTYFQKTCSWTRYNGAKLIQKIPNLSMALLHFCFRKTTEKYKFSMGFYFQ